MRPFVWDAHDEVCCVCVCAVADCGSASCQCMLWSSVPLGCASSACVVGREPSQGGAPLRPVREGAVASSWCVSYAGEWCSVVVYALVTSLVRCSGVAYV